MAGVSCGGRFAQIFLILLNIIVVLFGIAFLAVGLVFKFGENQTFVTEEIKPALQDVVISSYDLYDLVDAFTIVFIVVGAFLLLIGLLGLIGACCFVRWMLVLYAIILILIFIIEIVGIAFFFIMRKEFDDAVTLGMKKSIKRANDGNKEARESVIFMFDKFGCCKVDDDTLTNTTTKCLTDGSVATEDCYEKLKDKFDSLSLYFIIAGVFIAVIEILCIIFAFLICAQVHRDEKNQKVV